MVLASTSAPSCSTAEPCGARWAGWVGLIASIAAVVADLALQFTPDPSRLLSTRYLYLLDVPPERVMVGHYLGVVAILVEIAGFWPIYWALRPAGSFVAAFYFLLNAFCSSLGAAFHATVAFLALMVQAQARSSPETAATLADMVHATGSYRTGLILPAALGILVSTLLFAFLVVRRHTAFPRWMAACSPLSFVILLFTLGRVVPVLGLVVFPAGLNLAHLLFFALSRGVLARRTPTSP